MHNTVDEQPASQLMHRLLDAVANDETVMAVLGVDERAVLAVIDDCVELLTDAPIRVIRIRGSQGSPLTLPRIVQELGANQRDGLPLDDDELIVRVLTQPNNKGDKVLLIIEQSEFLPLRTLAFLQVISTVFNATTPKLQLLFSGRPQFRDLIKGEELAGIHDQLRIVIPVRDLPTYTAQKVSMLRSTGRYNVHGNLSTTFYAKHRKVIFAISIIAVIGAGFAFSVFQNVPNKGGDDGKDTAPVSGLTQPSPAVAGITAQPPSHAYAAQPPALPGLPAPITAPEPPYAPTPPQSDTRGPDPTTTSQPAKRRGAPTGEQLARLREEFEHFLAQTEWGSKRQSEGERSRLFNEFLQWNSVASSSSPEPSPQAASAPLLSQARVTLHFLATSSSGREMARQLATEMRPSVALARIRSVADVPKTFEVRYFAQEDASLARTLAQLLQAPDVTWTARIMPDFRPPPPSHTIEFWIPLR